MFSQFDLGSLYLKNRLAVAPMTRTSASGDGYVSKEMITYYSTFAAGGFGLIITEGTYTDKAFSQGYINQPGIADDQQAKSWGELVNSVHAQGAKIFIQLMHAGALTQGNRFRSETIAPSAIQPKGEQLSIYGGNGSYPCPREISLKEIDEVIKGFVHSAIRAKSVGFDGIELHGANGYLLDEFLTDYTNQRNDEYGGSLQGRVRLLVRVINAVKKGVGYDYPVGIRISQGKVNDGRHKWENGEEEAKMIFSTLAKADPSFIHVTEYDICQSAFQHGTKTLSQLAKLHSKVPIIANGNLHQPDQIKSILSSGDADLVSLGKAALANMDWPICTMTGASLKSFDPNMLQPIATLENAEKWKQGKL